MNPFPYAIVAGIATAVVPPGAAKAEGPEMTKNVETLKRMYARFNAKDVDGVLAMLDRDVAWANGMDGGHVQGHEGIRTYWTRQWSIVNPHVEPLSFSQSPDGSIVVGVDQTIRDLEGNPVQADGLKDRTVGHVFHFRDGKVVRFDIRGEE